MRVRAVNSETWPAKFCVRGRKKVRRTGARFIATVALSCLVEFVCCFSFGGYPPVGHWLFFREGTELVLESVQLGVTGADDDGPQVGIGLKN